MKIAIDAVCAENRSGTGRYTSELLRAIQASDVDMQFAVRVIEDSPLVELLHDDQRFEIGRAKKQHSMLRVLNQNRETVRWLRQSEADVLHGPAFVVPPSCPMPTVVTVHDLVFRLFPETITFLRRCYYNRAFGRSIREANLLLCDSENTRRDLMKHFGVVPEKARTVHLGVEPRFFEEPSAERLEAVREKYNLPERFFLTLGTLEPRKNLPRLIRSYADALVESEQIPPLVIAGRTGWGTDSIDELIDEPALKPHVILPGFIDDDDLPELYCLCDVFLHFSLYEGFGLPLLEAMASGALVLAGNNSSQPEILSDDKFLVDASDEECIRHALLNSLSWVGDCGSIREAHRASARLFSWEKTAAETLDAYRSAAGVKNTDTA